MNIGRFRERVTLQSPPVGRDGAGQPSSTWVDVAVVRADVRNLNGVEVARSGAKQGITTGSIRIRYRAGVAQSWRIKHGDTIYKVAAVLPNRREGYIDLACEAVNVST